MDTGAQQREARRRENDRQRQGAGGRLRHSAPRCEDILDEWDIPQDISEYRRFDAAVAQILLDRVQDRLSQWAAVTDDSFSSPDQSRIGAHCGRWKCCRVVFSRLTGPTAAPASHGQWPTTPPTYRDIT